MMSGAAVLLAASLLWIAATPSVPALHLAWSAPRLPAGSTFIASQLVAPKAALAASASQHFSSPQSSFFSKYAAYSGPPSRPASGLGTRPSVPISQADSTAPSTFKSGLFRCWRLIKLGFH